MGPEPGPRPGPSWAVYATDDAVGTSVETPIETPAGSRSAVPASRRPTGDGWIVPGALPPDADAESSLTWARAPEPPAALPAAPPTLPSAPGWAVPGPGWAAPPEGSQPPQGWGPPSPRWGPPPPGWGPPPPGWGPPAPVQYVPSGYGYDVPVYQTPPPWAQSGWAGWGGPPQPALTSEWMGFDPWKAAPRWGMPDILLGLLAFIVASIAVTLPVMMLTESKGLVAIASLAGSWLGLVGFLFYVSRKKGLGSFREDFGFRFQWVDPLLGFGIGLGTIFLAGIASTIVAEIFDAEKGSNSEQVFSDTSHAAIVIVTALMASIGAPLVEELFFRGLALRAVERRLGPTLGILGSAAVFGVLHWQPGTLGSTLSLISAISIFGLVFALLTRWQARLGPAIFAHMTINGIASSFAVYTYFSGHSPFG